MTTAPASHRGIELPNPSPTAVRLDALGDAGRLSAYRAGTLSRAELIIWAMRYPDEVPTINGEVEWIARSLADFD